MENNPTQKLHTKATRHYARVMAFAVVGVALAALLLFLVFNFVGQTPIEVVQIPGEQATTTTEQFARSAPSELRVPKIKLETSFESPLGLNPDQTIEVPDSYTKVGWYMHGATPGEIGTAVILGHVDSYEGPAVFWKLGQLEVGDEVEIDREDGTTAVFVVTELERVSQNSFPTEKVYAHTNEALLRLVTCSGTFLHGEQRYTHNLIVYAVLKQ
jgi:sortase (surface protein transpeptidase)